MGPAGRASGKNEIADEGARDNGKQERGIDGRHYSIRRVFFAKLLKRALCEDEPEKQRYRRRKAENQNFGKNRIHETPLFTKPILSQLKWPERCAAGRRPAFRDVRLPTADNRDVGGRTSNVERPKRGEDFPGGRPGDITTESTESTEVAPRSPKDQGAEPRSGEKRRMPPATQSRGGILARGGAERELDASKFFA